MACHEEDARAALTHKIRELNDRHRSEMPHGGVLLTRAVANSDPDAIVKIVQAVRAFESFTPANDPWGEHDFGEVVIGGEQFYWRIDAYDLNLEFGSPEPTDEAVTRRILTIMTAEDL